MPFVTPSFAAARPRGPARCIARAVLLAVALTSLAAATAQVRVAAYDLDIGLDPSARAVRVTALLRTAGAGRLTLRLSPLAQGIDVPDGTAQAGPDGWAVTFDALADGATVELRYALVVPQAAEGLALRLGADDGHLLPESDWFPVEASAWLAPPAPYRLTVRAPAGLAVVGAGAIAATPDGATTIEFERPGLPFLAYGRYRLAAGDGVELWLTPDLVASASRLLDLLAPDLRAITGVFHAWFTPACPTVRLVSVGRRGGWGAPCTLLLEEPLFARLAGAEALDADTFAFLAHELAHTWWGHGVAPELTAYGLLVEGTAEYLSALAVEERHGAVAAERLWRAWQDDAVGVYALDQLTPDRPAAYRLAYPKGAWVHRMLEGWLGRDAYLTALARLVRDDPRPSLASYRAALEAASGLPLGAFFAEWVHGVAYPRYVLEGSAGAWTLRNDGTAATPPLLVALDGVLERLAVPPGGRVVLTARQVVVDPTYHVLQSPAVPGAGDAAAAEAAMARFLAALATRDGGRFLEAFADPGPAVERLAELAAELLVDDWVLDQAVAEGGGWVFTFTVLARIGTQSIQGPLELAVGGDGGLTDVPRVSLRTR